MPRIVCSSLESGLGKGLTGISGNDTRNFPTPYAAIEGVKIRPDRSVIQGTVFNTRSQDFAGSDFVLHVADRASISDSSSDCTIKLAGACRNGEEGT